MDGVLGRSHANVARSVEAHQPDSLSKLGAVSGEQATYGVSMALLLDRRGNSERMKGHEIRIGCERCAIAQLNLVPAFANVRCRPSGNLPRLPFGRSSNN